MVMRISRACLEQIVGAARANPEQEICGLLLGHGYDILAVQPAVNISDIPEKRFEIDPAVLIRAHKGARSGGPSVLGHYHSHPNGSTEPSTCDAEMAIDQGALWLICTPDGQHQLWRAGREGLHGCFAKMDMDVAE